MFFNWPDTPKVPFPVAACTPHVSRSLDPLNSAYQNASRLVQPFLHSSRQSVPVLCNVC